MIHIGTGSNYKNSLSAKRTVHLLLLPYRYCVAVLAENSETPASYARHLRKFLKENGKVLQT
jgi:hypothetical protein